MIKEKHMRRCICIGCALLGAAMALFALSIQAQPTTEPVKKVVYKPPMRGAPAIRVGGGSRGAKPGEEAPPAVLVLGPEEVGQTTQESPALYWFISKPTDRKVLVTLSNDDDAEPLVEKKLSGVKTGGVQKLDLAAEGAKLTPGVQYRVTVAVVVDPANRSLDSIATCFVKRVKATDELTAALAKSNSPTEKAEAYAGNGMFYDALGALSAQVEAHPDDAGSVKERADFLGQVKLDLEHPVNDHR